MNYAKYSDYELLSLLLGEDYKEEMAKKQLIELFGYTEPIQDFSTSVQEAPQTYSISEIHPKLAIAKELITRCMEQKINTENSIFATTSKSMKVFLTGKLSHLENEVFMVLFFNNQNKLLATEIIFQGSISSCEIQPREVVKSTLKYNAASVMFSHNHPSGDEVVSNSDKRITKILKEALDTINVKVLDHIIVAKNEIISLAEKGLM